MSKETQSESRLFRMFSGWTKDEIALANKIFQNVSCSISGFKELKEKLALADLNHADLSVPDTEEQIRQQYSRYVPGYEPDVIADCGKKVS